MLAPRISGFVVEIVYLTLNTSLFSENSETHSSVSTHIVNIVSLYNYTMVYNTYFGPGEVCVLFLGISGRK